MRFCLRSLENDAVEVNTCHFNLRTGFKAFSVLVPLESSPGCVLVPRMMECGDMPQS